MGYVRVPLQFLERFVGNDGSAHGAGRSTWTSWSGTSEPVCRSWRCLPAAVTAWYIVLHLHSKFILTRVRCSECSSARFRRLVVLCNILCRQHSAQIRDHRSKRNATANAKGWWVSPLSQFPIPSCECHPFRSCTHDGDCGLCRHPFVDLQAWACYTELHVPWVFKLC